MARKFALLFVMILTCLFTESLSGQVRDGQVRDEPNDSQVDNAAGPDLIAVVSGGQLFIDGIHVRRPYRIETVGELHERRVFINDIPFRSSIEYDLEYFESGETEAHSSYQFSAPGGERDGFDRFSHDEGWRHKSRGRGASALRREAAQGSGGRESPREPREPGGLGGLGGLGEPHETRGPRGSGQAREVPADITARQLAIFLQNGAIIVAFDSLQAQVLELASHKADFCAALLSNPPSSEQFQKFMALAPEDQIQQWHSLLHDLSPSPELTAWMKSRIENFNAVESRNYREIFAVQAMEFSAYPLTVLGMMLGVFALGHTLKWSSTNPVGPEAVRFMKIALLLILGMSALDLTWTAIAGAAGQMKELNPMALGLIDSPWLLVAFKTSVTLAACGILLFLRSHAKAQFATWWMCLICVLLTFRWVVFNSLLV